MCQKIKYFNLWSNLKLTNEWIGLDVITLVIMSWSLILFVN